MAGLYIHFPYCEKKCLYCDFYSEVINHADILSFLKALKQEVALRSNSPDLEPKQIKTLYFGGGTPSLLTYDQMEDLLETVIFNFMIKPQSEITIEVNPGTLSKEKLKHLYQMGFNRMSIGIQSINREELRFLGRIHSQRKVSRRVKWPETVVLKMWVSI